ncbi:RidA family protein [Inquilinus sp. CA228]|uniref:RidA family protein n=1 Tax=Inquilinus sp. CA228 TaxID=3455609 RepID=UPI003F8D8B93
MSAATDAAAFTLSNPAGLYDPSANGDSHLAEVPAGTRLVFVAGQGGENEKAELSPDFRAQVRQAFANLRIALQAAGAGPRDVAKLTVLIVDHTEAKLHDLGAELEHTFGPGKKPTCTLIPVPRLALDAMLFEVEAVAVLPG